MATTKRVQKEVDSVVEKVESAAENLSDEQKNKISAVLAYFVFFIPLLWTPESKFARFHANQGLTLLLLCLAVNFIGGFIPIIGWFIVLPIGNLVSIILLIIGILNAVNGEKKPLPLIGKYQLLK